MNHMGFMRKAKLTGLATLLAGGSMLGSACSVADVRHNFVAGTQAFVKGYTTDLWGALIPTADELLNFGGDGE